MASRSLRFDLLPPLLGALAALAPYVVAACSPARYSTDAGGPSLVVPAHFAEGKPEPGAPRSSATATPPVAAAAGSASSASPMSSGSSPAPLLPSNLPDPPPLRMAEQVEYELELSEGKPRVVSVKPVKLAEPIVTPRRLGRYAIELSIGKELIDRVRFDFPGTAADEPQLGSKKPLFAPLTLSERAIARVKLLLPHSLRVRRAALVDRARNTATEIEWPLPDVPKAPVAPSSSVPAPAPASAPASAPKP